jgi:phosphate-selective porin OprO and OprP
MKKLSWKLKYAVLLTLMTSHVYADESTDDRIVRLQHMLKEQQQQIQVMAEELKALQSSKQESKGKPVMAAFKNGIILSDDSEDWKLSINGRVQADSRAFNPDETAADTFSLRRARLGARLTFYDDYSARVEGEYSGSNTSLTYAYIDINKFKQAKIRIGQFKPSYGLERAMSTNFTDFQERSMADALNGSTYDRGIMVHGTPKKGVYYSAAWINGSNGDETDVKVDNKDISARLTSNIAEFTDWKDTVLHLGGFYAYGKQGAGSAIPSIQTEARGYKFFETTNTTNNTFSEAVNRTRRGLELAIARGPVKLQSEYNRASFDGQGFSHGMSAWYASMNWLVTGETFSSTYKDGVFDRLIPKNNFSFDGEGWGALQLGIRYSHFDASDFTISNAMGAGKLAAAKTNQVSAWTLGANWILNPNTRLIANYVHTDFDDFVTILNKKIDHEDAITMRAQFDF